MLWLGATINLLDEDNTGKVGSVEFSGDDVGNNISIKEFSENDIVNNKQKVVRPFILGRSTLGTGKPYYKQLKYYMGSQMSRFNVKDSKFHFDNPYRLKINYTDDTKIIAIEFDDLQNTHPESVIVEIKNAITEEIKKFTYPMTSATLIIDCEDIEEYPLARQNTFTVVIDNWNTNNSPLIISGVYCEFAIVVDKSNVEKIECPHYTRSEDTEPCYGVYSNTGNISLLDVDNRILQLAEMNLLKNNSKVVVYVKDDTEQQISKGYITSWNYDYSNRTCSCEFADGLIKLQDYNFTGYAAKKIDFENGFFTALDIFNQAIKQMYKLVPNALSSDFLNESGVTNTELSNYLKNFSIWANEVEKTTLWDIFTYVAELCRLYIYVNLDNKIEIDWESVE